MEHVRDGKLRKGGAHPRKCSDGDFKKGIMAQAGEAQIVNLDEGWAEIKQHGLDALENIMEGSFRQEKLFENEIKMRIYT